MILFPRDFVPRKSPSGPPMRLEIATPTGVHPPGLWWGTDSSMETPGGATPRKRICPVPEGCPGVDRRGLSVDFRIPPGTDVDSSLKECKNRDRGQLRYAVRQVSPRLEATYSRALTWEPESSTESGGREGARSTEIHRHFVCRLF